LDGALVGAGSLKPCCARGIHTHKHNETNKFPTEENHYKVEMIIITKLRNARVGLTHNSKERKKERTKKHLSCCGVSQLRDVVITNHLPWQEGKMR
jgi:hypothetical protein